MSHFLEISSECLFLYDPILIKKHGDIVSKSRPLGQVSEKPFFLSHLKGVGVITLGSDERASLAHLFYV